MKQKHRGQWAGNLGFIMAAAGSAVGLGNLVKFPYLAGRYGGGAFLFIYLVMLVLVGFTILLAELVVGRATHKNEVGAFRQLDKRFTWVGALGILTGFIITCYYNVIGGWTIKYIMVYLGGGRIGDSGTFFGGFISSGFEPLVWLALFLGAGCFIVWRGVSGGIERASKILMSGLVALLLVIVARGVTLPGAAAGLRYYLVPDFSHVGPDTVVAALAQVFFSLSLGMGIMCTYGSYVPDSSNLSKNALIIPIFDSAIAIISGFAVLPAMLATGMEPTESTIGALFEVMPAVFSAMPLPRIFGSVFFLLVLFAALTSSISLMEGTVAYVIEEWKMSRGKAVVLVGGVLYAVGCLASLSLGGNINIRFPQLTSSGIGISDLFDFLANTPDLLLMPFGGLMICIFVGWIWGVDKASDNIEQGGKLKFHLKRYWKVGVRYVAPLAIIVILLSQFGIFG